MRFYVLMSILLAGVLTLSACQPSERNFVAEWNIEPPPAAAAKADRTGTGAVRASDAAAAGRAAASPTLLAQGTGRLIGNGRTRDRQNPAAGDDGVTLNLVNLPIAEAAKIVLGDIEGVDYVIDPRLDGKITAHTSHPVAKREALELFQSALRVSGAALVRSGGVYKIVPLDAAATSGGDITAGAAEAGGFGSGANVVQLRYVSASEMKRVLDPIAAKGGLVRADDSRHTVTLTGSPQEVATLRDAIALFDVDTMRGMSFALVPVKSSDPNALSDDLRNVFGSEKEGPMNGMIQFIGNKKLSAILVISSQRAYLERARAWIQRLDARAQGSEKQLYTYRVQNRPAKELLQVLESMFGPEAGGKSGSSVSPRQSQTSVSSANAGFLGQNGNPPSNPIGGINSSGGQSTTSLADVAAAAKAESGAEASTGPKVAALGEDSRFRLAADDAKNALVIMATPDDYRRLLHVIETLDVLPNQVFIEATIAEVTLNDNLQFGVEWFFQRGKSAMALSQAGTANGPTIANTPLGDNLLGASVASTFPGFNYALRTASAQVTLNALNAITNVNIISTPSLTVLDNHQAVLQVGDQVPVTSLQSATALGNTFTSVSYKDTGVILSITPHISESGRVMLQLVQEVSNVAPGTANGSTTPTIQQRKVNTQVVVTDGDSLMLGGLMQNSRSNVANQVPVLGDVPIFGNAFKNNNDTIAKTELLIMITPHVVRSVGEAREITEEYKRQILSVSRKAIKRPHSLRQTFDRAILDQ
ncbi:MAG TPA: type II secretion system secretin GspD [Rhodoblastus sp.]|nr:type II secretion system secretin GspD [Rhodoblastus sp.]